MILKSLRLLFLVLVSAVTLQAQTLDITPPFPTADDTVTIVYDASQGNGALVGITPVYAHAGLITTNSTSPTDWKYVQGNWGQADPNVLMTDLGNNKHQIKYHIRTYYGLPMNETALELAFVFRNAAGNTVGRASDGSDIYYPLYQPGSGLAARFFTPTEDNLLVNANDNISLYAGASGNATLTIFDNGTQVAQATNTKQLFSTITASVAGSHLVELVADDGVDVVRDTFYYVVLGNQVYQNAPAGIEPGITYTSDTSITLALYAPHKNYVFVVGDFNGWQLDPNYRMNVSMDSSLYWLEIDGLQAGQQYAFQYEVDGQIRIGDPYSELVLDPWNDGFISPATFPNLKPYPTGLTNEPVTLIEMAKPDYQWQVTNFQKPNRNELVIYELLPRDFVATHNYQTLIDTLDYLVNLGINAIELMPVNEFEGNESWGYNPSFHGALDKYYGTPEKFKEFVDECHARGIAVIVDVVLNHAFGQNPYVRLYWDAANNQPAANSPFFNPIAKHDFNVGYDFNHDSPATQYYVDRMIKYWIDEYKVDGYRFDLSKGFTQKNTLGNVGAWGAYDADRIALWKNLSDTLWAKDPNFYVILEHFANNDEEKELANYGMMLWGNLNHEYNEATMGYGSNFQWISYKNRGWNDPHVVGYMESHDEERLMYKNLQFGSQNSDGTYKIKNLNVALDRVGLAAAFFFTIPGPKMIWQFGEVGYDISIDNPCRVCNKPILWNYFTQPDRRDLYNMFSELIKLRNSHPVFDTDDFELSVGSAGKRIKLNHPDMDVVVIGNFGVTPLSVNPNYQSTGWWYDYFSGDSINVTNVNTAQLLGPGDFIIYTSKKLAGPSTPVTSTKPTFEEALNANVFPNPTNGLTNIIYELPAAMRVQLDVVNLLGQKVDTITEENQQSGWQHLQWSSSHLPKGQYFIRILTAQGLHTMPIVVE